jgi:hypothetical protein
MDHSKGYNELVEEPDRREVIINNIERQKELLLINILGENWLRRY